jgi:putative phage-type endonuclease
MEAFHFDTMEENSDMESVVETISDLELEIKDDSDNESDTVDSLSWFDSIPESELNELETTIYDLMDDHLNNPAEIIKIMKPNFQNEFVSEITHIIYQTLFDSGNCNEEAYEELKEFVEQIFEVSMDMNEIPLRSEPTNSHEAPSLHLSEISVIEQKIRDLKNIPQPPQKSKEWYEFRHGLITASNIYKVFGTEAKYNELVYEKCKPLDLESSERGSINTESPMHWGVKYEPLTILMYEKRYKTKIADFGCIPHPKYKCIGASPDGINNDPASPLYGRMIEIKNIFNREIDGIPTEAYWTQMQMQMEICDLDSCDFVETRFKQYGNSDEFWQDNERVDRGVILYFVRRDAESVPPFYKYMPLDIPLEERAVNEWIESVKSELKSEWILYETHYWYLDEFSCVLVRRNKKWFECAIPKIENTWNTILREREEGYEHRAAKKQKQQVEVLSAEDGTHYIRNIPANKPICLIKLDK